MGVGKSEVRVFIWTISDIAAVIIFIFFVVAAICAFIPARTDYRQSERKNEPEPKQEVKPRPEEAQRGKGDWVAYMLLALFLLAAAVVFITIKK
jgi:ascorbate-specific PTS system EIIC-type component UlaA